MVVVSEGAFFLSLLHSFIPSVFYFSFFCSNFSNQTRLGVEFGFNWKSLNWITQLLLSSTGFFAFLFPTFLPLSFLISRADGPSQSIRQLSGDFEHCFQCDNQVSAWADSLLDLHQAAVQTQRKGGGKGGSRLTWLTFILPAKSTSPTPHRCTFTP